jgi:hypothetical protein
MHSHPYEHTYVKHYLYEHLRKTVPTNLEIHKVTTDALLSMRTLPTTESIAPLNPRINPEKYEHQSSFLPRWNLIFFYQPSMWACFFKCGHVSFAMLAHES